MPCDLSRRSFLTNSSICALALTPGTLHALTHTLSNASEHWIYSVCEMCSSRCPLQAKVSQGKVVGIQGNVHARPTGTALCARGVAGISQLYDPKRLIKPLMRVGKRGENRWKEVSLDEAIAFIAHKMQEIRQDHGAQSILFSAKTGESYEHLKHFAYTFGSPNIFSHWSTCPAAIKSASLHTFGAELNRDFAHAKYILNFGHNLFEGIDIALSKPLADFAADRTKKLVVLEPRFSIVAAKAREWHPIIPGSDLAFVLALIHVFIRDQIYDKAFVHNHCIGFEAVVRATQETTPTWQKRYTGIEPLVVERIAHELYEAAPHCIIDWGHKATTSPAEYQRTRAILIANALMGNIETRGGIYFPKEAAWINAFVGEAVVPELSQPLQASKPTIMRIDRAGEEGAHRFISPAHGLLQAIPEAIITQKPYAIKGWILTRHNPLITAPSPLEMKKAMEALELIVVNDLYVSETAMMADVIIPEASYLERDEGIVEVPDTRPTYTMRSKAIEPIGGTLSCADFLRRLALKLNGHEKGYAWKSMHDYRMAQAKGDGALLEQLSKQGIYQALIPELFCMQSDAVNLFCDTFPSVKAKQDAEGKFSCVLSQLATPSGKIELFSAEVESYFKGYGTIGVHEMDVRGKHPLTLISGKSALHTNGHTYHVPFLNDLVSSNPVWIHPKTAHTYGLRDQDTCVLFNAYGRVKASVFVTEGVRPDTLFVYMGCGHEGGLGAKGFNPSTLLPLHVSPVSGSIITNVGVSIEKA